MTTQHHNKPKKSNNDVYEVTPSGTPMGPKPSTPPPPPKHGETHCVCNKRLESEGGKARCCECVPHEGCESASDHNKPADCPTCSGTGFKYWDRKTNLTVADPDYQSPCPMCNGTGEVQGERREPIMQRVVRTDELERNKHLGWFVEDGIVKQRVDILSGELRIVGKYKATSPDPTGHIQAEREKPSPQQPGSCMVCGHSDHMTSEHIPPTPNSAGEAELRKAMESAVYGATEKVAFASETGIDVEIVGDASRTAVEVILVVITQLYNQRFEAAIKPLPGWNKIIARSRWYDVPTPKDTSKEQENG